MYWERYEAENYFITPALLVKFAKQELGAFDLFGGFRKETQEIIDQLTLEQVFAGDKKAFETYRKAEAAAADLIWTTSTKQIKLSTFAEEFFRRLSAVPGTPPMLLRKDELYRLIPLMDAASLPGEVRDKLDAVQRLLTPAV